MADAPLSPLLTCITQKGRNYFKIRERKGALPRSLPGQWLLKKKLDTFSNCMKERKMFPWSLECFILLERCHKGAGGSSPKAADNSSQVKIKSDGKWLPRQAIIYQLLQSVDKSFMRPDRRLDGSFPERQTSHWTFLCSDTYRFWKLSKPLQFTPALFYFYLKNHDPQR